MRGKSVHVRPRADVSEVLPEYRIPHSPWVNPMESLPILDLIIYSGEPTQRWMIKKGLAEALFFYRWGGAIWELKFALNRDGKISVGSADASLITSGVFDRARIPIQSKRVTYDLPSGYSAINVPWDTAFPDTNYTVVASVFHNSAGATIHVERIYSKATNQVVVYVHNESGGTLTGVTTEAIAIHD